MLEMFLHGSLINILKDEVYFVTQFSNSVFWCTKPFLLSLKKKKQKKKKHENPDPAVNNS